MSNTFRTLVLVVVLTVILLTGTAAVGIARDSGPSGDPPSCGETERRSPQSPGDGAQHASILALRRAGREFAGLVDDVGRSLGALDERQEEIARIEGLGVRIADWAGTDNDPLFDGLVAERFAAILELVGGDLDLARRTVRNLRGGIGVAEALERGWQEILAGRIAAVTASLGGAPGH